MPGDFSKSLLPDIVGRINNIWSDSRLKNNYTTCDEAVMAITENQNVSWNPVLKDATNCIGYNAVWLNNCEGKVQDCEDSKDCVIGGDSLLDSDSKLYNKNFCFFKEFSVADDECRNEFDKADKLASSFMAAMRDMRAEFNKRMIAFIDANAGINAYTGTYGTIDATTSSTCFNASYWGDSLMAHLDLTASVNQISNPILLTGTLLYESIWNARKNRADGCCDKNSLGKYEHFPNWYTDTRCLDNQVGQRVLYMIDPNNVGYFNATQYTNLTESDLGDKDRTVVFSMYDPQYTYRDGNTTKRVRYDVEKQVVRIKAADGTCRLKESYKVTHRGGLHLGPADCNQSTGILKFTVC